MEIKANVKHIRISPRKLRLVVDAVRGLNIAKASQQLKFINKRGTEMIEKLLKSAVANATNNFELDENNLYIKEIKVDEGKTLKRWMPRAHGRATTIRKRTSHVNIALSEIKDSGVKAAKKQKIEAPVNLEDMMKKSEGAKDDKKTITKEKSQAAKTEKKGFASRVFRRKSG